MFVGQQRGDYGDAGPRGPREGETRREGREQDDYADVHDAGDQESVGDAEALGNGKEAGAAIVIDVLAGVENIEAADPEGYGGAEKKHTGIEAAGDGDPRGRGRNAESEAEDEVGPTGEAFGEGIEKEYEHSGRREFQCHGIQLPGREDEHADVDGREEPGEGDGEGSGG